MHYFITIFGIKGDIMLKYYAHTFSKYHDFMLFDLESLENILKSGFLLSRRKLNLPKEDALFNGMDYISLCDLEKEHSDNSAYNLYVKRGASLLFSKDFNVIHPTIIQLDRRHINLEKKIYELSLKGRFSDLDDEVQVKDQLSLEYLKGLLISISAIKSCHSDEYIISYLGYMKELCIEYRYIVPLINLDDEQVIELSKKKL